MESNKNSGIEYEERKAKRFKIKDGIEFYVIDELESSETEGGISVKDLGARGKRATKRRFEALIVHDPEFGSMPYNVWEEKRRQQVMGTISPYIDSPPTLEEVVVTPSHSIIMLTTTSKYRKCPKCESWISEKLDSCPNCDEYLGKTKV